VTKIILNFDLCGKTLPASGYCDRCRTTNIGRGPPLPLQHGCWRQSLLACGEDFWPGTCRPMVRPLSPRPLAFRRFCFSPLDNQLADYAGRKWFSGVGEWWWQSGRARCGAVRCVPEEHRTAWGSAARVLVVTGRPAPTVTRAAPTRNDRFATRNATARSRHRA